MWPSASFTGKSTIAPSSGGPPRSTAPVDRRDPPLRWAAAVPPLDSPVGHRYKRSARRDSAPDAPGFWPTRRTLASRPNEEDPDDELAEGVHLRAGRGSAREPQATRGGGLRA